MTPRRPRHILTVWNPTYADSAIDAHLAVLLDWAEKRAAGNAGAEDVYVWWAKLRSENRRQELPHAADILALQAQIDRDVETHLYLTDYRSLYVAHLDEITADDVPGETPDEVAHMPAYYVGRPVDFWFRLLDVRRLVADDTPATVRALQQLKNTRYHGRPVSLYGGMVDLPLIVTREEERSWFADTGALLEGRLWAEREAERRGETERMARELRDNLLGREVWAVLEPASRTFLASAEAVFRVRRDDPRFDFSGPAVEYAKAIETELNALLFPALRRVFARARPAEREIRVEGRHLDLGKVVPHQTLGALRRLLEEEEVVRKGVRTTMPGSFEWFLNALPHELAALADLRNPAAHAGRVGAEAAGSMREEVLGIGCEGLIVKLARVKERV
jgi:hypothetical protein